MTPTTPPEQPKEYIIAEARLDQIITCTNREECEDCPYEKLNVVCIPATWEKEIRSRPIASEPTESEITNKILRTVESDECQQEHDTAIRNAEGVKWATALNTLIATESKRTSKETVDMVYSYRIAQIVDELWQQSTEARHE